MKKIIFIISLVILKQLSVYSQTINPREFNYSHVDSIALNFPKNGYDNISSLADSLTKNLKSEHEKFRVVFRWITDNIEYSYSNSTGDADKVLKNRKAVCEGYASLLKALCDKIGLECQIIHGYAKNKVGQIGKNFKETNHAWNIVKLYDKWYLVDATWASGYNDRVYKKRFDESYFLADPNFFIITHFPKDKKYQLLDKLCKKKDFINFPIIYYSYIIPIDKINGIVNNNLFIRFKSKKSIENISLAFITDKYSREIEFENKDGIYEINYIFKESDKGEFTLFADNECIFSFKKK